MRGVWIPVTVAIAVTLAAVSIWWLAAPGAHVVIKLDSKAIGRDGLQAAMSAHLEDVKKRAGGLGWMTRDTVRVDGDKFVIDIAGFYDLETLRQVFGPHPPLSLRLVDDDGYDPLNDERARYLSRYEGKDLAVRRIVLMTGRHFLGARPTYETFGTAGRPAVDIRLDGEGAQEFAQITRRYAGKRMALMLGHAVITAPQITGPITGGSFQINGNFTPQDSEDLAALITASAGDWPFTLLVIGET